MSNAITHCETCDTRVMCHMERRCIASPEAARFVRMFAPRFAPLVESGAKSHTVRPDPKRMPKPGDAISLRAWTEKPYRSKQRVLREAVIESVQEIAIYGDSIHIGERRLSREQREAFARADGFTDFADLAQWFRSTHDLPFHGILISWANDQEHLASES